MNCRTPQAIMGDGLPPMLVEMLGPEIEVLPWDVSPGSPALEAAVGVITYGHPLVDGPLMDRTPNLKVISNHGVGVDHIDVAAAAERKIPVGNTPGCLDASTADRRAFVIVLALLEPWQIMQIPSTPNSGAPPDS